MQGDSLISVNLAFTFLAGVIFLGFIVTAFFDKFRITSVLPLMLIGLLVGPILKLINSSPGSTIAQLTPYVTALTISFVLFDVGLNINFSELREVLLRATGFMSLLVILTALASAALAFYAFGWNLIEALIFGFAISGPSSILVPTLLRSVKLGGKLRVSLLYEGVATDTFQLIIPILLLGIIVSGKVSAEYAASLFASDILASMTLGFIFALFWLYILSRFRKQSREYIWILTIAMVIATYGIAQELGMSGAIAIFIFGMAFANIGAVKAGRDTKYASLLSGLAIKPEIDYIKRYQKEITFFASVFFFVYIGLLFNLSAANDLPYLILIGFAITVVIFILRFGVAPVLKGYMRNESSGSTYMFKRAIVASDLGRGLSPAIVATLPLSLGIVIPGFLNEVFIIIFLTNLISAVVIFVLYKDRDRAARDKEEGR